MTKKKMTKKEMAAKKRKMNNGVAVDFLNIFS